MRDLRQFETDLEFENKIRPQQLDNFSGQGKIVENLRIFIESGSGLRKSENLTIFRAIS
jgi:Holliday junction DNA helicase RuvB